MVKKGNGNGKVPTGWVLLILAVIAIGVVFSGCSQNNLTLASTPTPTPTPTETATPQYSDEQLRQFVSCLNESGVKIYGAKWCSHCQDLVKKLGGYDIVSPIYVECTENKQLCQEKRIQYYPTIIINGTEYKGPRTYQALSQATGCPFPQ